MIVFDLQTKSKFMKHIFIATTLLISLMACNSGSDDQPKYKNKELSMDSRVDDLLSRMTVEEKVFQMCALRLGDGDEIFKTSGDYSIDFIRSQMKDHGVGHISCPTSDMRAKKSVETANEIQRVAVEETRLGIPTIINDEALHGCKGAGSTSYPQAIALSSTWDLALMTEIANAIGKETKSRGIRHVLSPNLDLARDPRHGRMEETYGEDPFLSSRFGVEFIKGVQGQGVICAPKHFVANFVGAGGRDSGNIPLSERELREIHLVPYEAAVKEAKVKSIMAAYNAINGVPCSSNHWLLTEILRNEWGFDGFTVSDWSGVNHTYQTHQSTRSFEEAAMVCSKAGMDVDLPRLRSYQTLITSIKEGKIKEASIDKNVRSILRTKFEMGLFENPYILDESQAEVLEDAPEHRALALKAARKSIILLKNENDVLPLKLKNIAVIGPNADKLILGGYSARDVQGPSPLEGIKKAFGPDTKINYAKGCDFKGSDKTGFAEAMKMARQSQATILVMGGRWGGTGGEGHDRMDLDLMGVQNDLIQKIIALKKPVVVVLVDGRPSTVTQWIDKVDGLVMMFFAGEEGGTALGEILTGATNPSGKLTITYPRHTGQLPMPMMHRAYGREGNVVELKDLGMTHPNGEKVDTRFVPLFHFGHGLSYSSFEYGEIKLSAREVKLNDNINVSINVTNTSNIDGDEIVQLYLTDIYCRITQPRKQLKAFKRVSIAAGQTKKVDFEIKNSDMSFLNEALKSEIEPGEFEVMVGTSSAKGVVARFNVN